MISLVDKVVYQHGETGLLALRAAELDKLQHTKWLLVSNDVRIWRAVLYTGNW